MGHLKTIVHFSDWHGELYHLPEADLYVCTGDMMDNYPKYDRDTWFKIIPEHEAEMQTRAAKQHVKNGGFRRYLGSPDAPLVCVRGNHDFIDLKLLFEGCNLVHEFIDNELVEAAGLKITGHRGIPYIYGTWSDEVQRGDLKDRFRAMPHADVYVTHYPCGGVLDSSGGGGDYDPRGISHWGLEGMQDVLMYRMTPALHCFGHIHEHGGQTDRNFNVVSSNAATHFNVVQF